MLHSGQTTGWKARVLVLCFCLGAAITGCAGADLITLYTLGHPIIKWLHCYSACSNALQLVSQAQASSSCEKLLLAVDSGGDSTNTRAAEFTAYSFGLHSGVKRCCTSSKLKFLTQNWAQECVKCYRERMWGPREWMEKECSQEKAQAQRYDTGCRGKFLLTSSLKHCKL